MDPAPRLSILHALSDPLIYATRAVSTRDRLISQKRPVSHHSSAGTEVDNLDGNDVEFSVDRAPLRTSKRQKRVHSAVVEAVEEFTDRTDTLISPRKDLATRESAADVDGTTAEPAAKDEKDKDMSKAGDLQDVQNLFVLWKSAGRNINLWDWLDGFRSMSGSAAPAEEGARKSATGKAKDSGRETETSGVAADRGEDGTAESAAPVEGEQEEEEEDEDHELDDRLHATFVRFVEEARMLGLVRARGKGVKRGADEVVKGIGLV